MDEILRVIREEEAPTPSSRISTAQRAATAAALRQSEPKKLGKAVKGELDWIVMKALSKERDRRYETANGFARDIERFLNHEPVVAGPPSATVPPAEVRAPESGPGDRGVGRVLCLAGRHRRNNLGTDSRGAAAATGCGQRIEGAAGGGRRTAGQSSGKRRSSSAG